MTSLQAVGFNNCSSGAFARTQRNSRPQVRACKPTQFLNADLPTLQDPKADSQLGELQVGDFVKFKDNPECTGTIFEVLDAIADRGVPLHNIVILLSLL